MKQNVQTKGVSVLLAALVVLAAGCANDSGDGAQGEDPRVKMMRLPPSQKLTEEQKASFQKFTQSIDILTTVFSVMPTKSNQVGETISGADRTELAVKIKATCTISPKVETDDFPKDPSTIRSGVSYRRSSKQGMNGTACVTPFKEETSSTSTVISFEGTPTKDEASIRAYKVSEVEKASWSVGVIDPDMQKSLGFSSVSVQFDGTSFSQLTGDVNISESKKNGVGVLKGTSGSDINFRLTRSSYWVGKRSLNQNGKLDTKFNYTTAEDIFVSYNGVEYVLSTRYVRDEAVSDKGRFESYINGELDQGYAFFTGVLGHLPN